MQSQEHWETVYATKDSHSLSWYQAHAAQSLRLIRETGVPLTAKIIDVGGGASTLVDDLLADGYTGVSVLDLSATALAVAQRRLGAQAALARWLHGDVTQIPLAAHTYDIWHDRAVFHFLTDAETRRAYVDAVLRSVKPGGHVIVATFAEDGPLQCSGLPVVRYDPNALHAQFGAPFALVRHLREEHQTPNGAVQQFIYCYCRKLGS